MINSYQECLEDNFLTSFTLRFKAEKRSYETVSDTPRRRRSNSMPSSDTEFSFFHYRVVLKIFYILFVGTINDGFSLGLNCFHSLFPSSPVLPGAQMSSSSDVQRFFYSTFSLSSVHPLATSSKVSLRKCSV